MQVEFDVDKDAIDRFKHRLPLAFGRRVFDDPEHVIVTSFRPVDGEDRFKAIGFVEGQLHTAIFVWRNDNIRLISVRRSNGSEQRDYDRDPG